MNIARFSLRRARGGNSNDATPSGGSGDGFGDREAHPLLRTAAWGPPGKPIGAMAGGRRSYFYAPSPALLPHCPTSNEKAFTTLDFAKEEQS
jgi:hypothetical protein